MTDCSGPFQYSLGIPLNLQVLNGNLFPMAPGVRKMQHSSFPSNTGRVKTGFLGSREYFFGESMLITHAVQFEDKYHLLACSRKMIFFRPKPVEKRLKFKKTTLVC